MAKNAINYIGIIPETGDSFESATQNATGSLDGIDNKLGELNSVKLEKGGYVGNAQSLKNNIDTNLTTLISAISARTEKGTYSGTAGQLKAMIDSLATTGTITPDLKNYMELVKNENNIKVVQGVPVGGQKMFGNISFAGVIKIKLPKSKSNAMYRFFISLHDYAFKKNWKFWVNGFNHLDGVGSTALTMGGHRVIPLKDVGATDDLKFYFCTGATEDYILIGEVGTQWNHLSVTISNVETMYVGITDDWSKDWDISVITTLENLDSINKITVAPSLNATHLNGTMTSNANSGITQKKTSTEAINIQDNSGTSHFKVNTTNRFTDIKSYISKYKGANVASATTIAPTGEIFHVTGTAPIATITPPTGLTDCMQITIIPDGIFTTTTAGNIALATTAVVNRALTMTYDATTSKWYPSY